MHTVEMNTGEIVNVQIKRAWCKKAEAVLVHDWPQDAIGQAVPYGIYDVTANAGFVCVGDCFDTPRFAVDAIVDWWFSTRQDDAIGRHADC